MAVIITVRGHERRYAGQLANIYWPSGTLKDVYNKNLDGKYLVKSVTHYFGMKRPTYTQKLVLVKTGYTDSNSRNLVKASKTNIEFKNQRLGTII
jgi:hypothetical protein